MIALARCGPVSRFRFSFAIVQMGKDRLESRADA